MILIVGLGNPGKKFFQTRHNIGFLFLDYLKKFGSFPSWRKSEKLEAKISKGKLFKKDVLLAKPQTFINNSGEAILKIKKFYKLLDENIWVVHDDIGLEVGRIKISKEKGAGGHKGVQSIINSLETKNFVRFRIGIRPRKKIKNLKNFVLEKFTKEERRALNRAKRKFILAIELALKENLEKVMTEINK
ncbi:MAG: aminoacyl-tRNA hydrolase [Candidatus Pacebacteria bacterium]|nr:aminoacyl-tRNA hydrolase [Candidatus Paceibacterota bacterium]